jgi:hypothetical protein
MSWFTAISVVFTHSSKQYSWQQPRILNFISFEINGGVQLVLFVVDSDRLLIDSNAIRTFRRPPVVDRLFEPNCEERFNFAIHTNINKNNYI